MVKITTTPKKKSIDLCQPSTSTNLKPLTESTHLNKSIHDYLQNAPENKRKFIRQTEKDPFVILENLDQLLKKKN